MLPEAKDLIDHGVGHVDEVLKKIDDLTQTNAWPRAVCDVPSYREIYLLRLTALFHDLGNIIGRGSHEIRSCNIIESIKRDLLLDDDVVRLVKFLISHHRKRGGMQDLCNCPPDYLFQEPVRLDLLVALFRLADACDMGSRSAHSGVGERAPRMVFETIRGHLNSRSLQHWHTHMAVLGTSVDPGTGHIVVQRRDRKNIRLLVDELRKEIESVNPILVKYHLPFGVVEIVEHA